ncbi:hypothetical protein F383_32156 [Gossypium arboreum]|uniref:Uncharacterized protein n=1 Tax=Gossypium arboreum TaxID=29729 RepID=A0A0B0N1F6_GOSAR|nr:hypothetical protein F383_32156 [Gossypium arboreum]
MPFCLLDSSTYDAESQRTDCATFPNIQSGRSLHKLKISPITGHGRKHQPCNAAKQ